MVGLLKYTHRSILYEQVMGQAFVIGFYTHYYSSFGDCHRSSFSTIPSTHWEHWISLYMGEMPATRWFYKYSTRTDENVFAEIRLSVQSSQVFVFPFSLPRLVGLWQLNEFWMCGCFSERSAVLFWDNCDRELS